MIDLGKDKNFQKKMTGIELTDNQGLKYQYKAVTDAQGFPGYIAECKGVALEGGAQPRHVRLTDEIVFIPNDLAGEFLSNLTKALLA